MSPSRAVLALGLAGGLLFLVVTPPFQVPDEPVHFLRAYQVSEGDLFTPGGPAGGRLPASLGASIDRFDDLWLDPREQITPGDLARALAEPLAPERRASTWLGAVAVYTPVPYLAPAAGALAGRTLGFSPVAVLYLERLANLAVALLLAWTAVRLAPFAAWPLALVALLPMAMFLRSSASADALTDAAALLVAAAALAAAFGPAAGRRRALVLLAAGSLALVLAKGVYFLLPLAALLVPASQLGSRRRAAAAFAGLLLVSALGFSASAWTARRGFTPLRPGVDVRPAEQAREVARRPLRFLGLAAADYLRHGPRYAAQLVGKLGWLDTPLPPALVAGYALLLAGLSLVGGSPQVAFPISGRLLLAALAAGTLLLLALSQYLTWTPVGAGGVEGLQGRYLIPVAPFVVPLLGSRRWARDLTGPRVSWALFAAAALATATALATVAGRFYEL